uniref:C2H2-type domain-containing protein n=1 Tax=Anabas testudineus TaxID=64144 RepID=A0A3Q1IEY6_ANATE
METEERKDVSLKCTATINTETEEDVTSGHTCAVCGRSFPLLSSLSQHMRRHTREKPYKCPYCEHRTAQKGRLKAHIRSHKLGLFSHNLSDTEGNGNQEQKDNTETPDTPEIISTSDKAHNVNGKIKKKGTKKKVKGKEGAEVSDGADAGSFSCTICGQVFPQVILLKSHMKRHRSSQDHGCRICGRRFRQAWFLQSHMRIHRVKGRLKSSKSNEPPATINGVPQDPASLMNEECLYELCAGCGNFFSDRKTLRIHEKLHKLNHSRSQMQNLPQENHDASETHIPKKHFLESLNLTCAGRKETSEQKTLSRRIPELDPVCSYQAWQLATKGRLVEATEKCLGWEERLADAEVAYDTEKGEYVPRKQEKKRKQINNSNKNPYFCEHCDFHTADATLLRSHLHKNHQDVLGLYSKHSPILDNHSGSKASRYMDYLRHRSVLLSQPYWNPYTCLPGQASVESNIKTEKSSGSEVKEHRQTTTDTSILLNLSALPVSEGDGAVNYQVKTESLVRHQCPYCSHTTNYPEVLWIHQRVAHRVDGNSSVAPKWAPRTGPPPFLEGKDCPALPAPRTQRTQRPGYTTPSSSVSSKHSAPKTHSGVIKSKHQSKDSRSSEGTHPRGRVGLLPQKKSDEHGRALEGGSKGSSAQGTSSSSTVHNKSVSSFQPVGNSKQKGPRAAVEGNFPPEGLGFMLARNHGGTTNTATNRPHSRRQSCDSSSGPKGPDVWAAMNMWGLHGSKAYLEPLLFAQGKTESTGETPMDIDILSLLKNYSPHDLAALYQHWGFVDPRIDPQVHSSSEASKQVCLLCSFNRYHLGLIQRLVNQKNLQPKT